MAVHYSRCRSIFQVSFNINIVLNFCSCYLQVVTNLCIDAIFICSCNLHAIFMQSVHAIFICLCNLQVVTNLCIDAIFICSCNLHAIFMQSVHAIFICPCNLQVVTNLCTDAGAEVIQIEVFERQDAVAITTASEEQAQHCMVQLQLQQVGCFCRSV